MNQQKAAERIVAQRDILQWLYAEQRELLAWALSSLVRNHPDYPRQLEDFLAGMRENIAAGLDPLTGETLSVTLTTEEE